MLCFIGALLKWVCLKIFYTVLNEEYMITVQSYINSFFAIRRGCLLVSCRVLFYMEQNSELFLFRRMVWNGISRICVYFWSKERNSKLLPLPWKGSERNSKRILFRETAGIMSEIPLCSDYYIFRGIIFCWKFPTLMMSSSEHLTFPVSYTFCL